MSNTGFDLEMLDIKYGYTSAFAAGSGGGGARDVRAQFRSAAVGVCWPESVSDGRIEIVLMLTKMPYCFKSDAVRGIFSSSPGNNAKNWSMPAKIWMVIGTMNHANFGLNRQQNHGLI